MPVRDGSATHKSGGALATAQSAALRGSSASWQPVLVNNDTSPSAASPAHETTVQKRARKTTSRAAREAQRKLNHSMIEKVRRTKINEALATLKSLVPLDHAQHRENAPTGDDEDEEHDASDRDLDAPDDSRPGKKPAKPSVKKDKEKEYKLEILVRTVSFVQDLVEKVKLLEDANRDKSLCPKCGGASKDSSLSSTPPGRKRKRVLSNDDEGEGHDSRSSKCPSPEIARLPSISSWLPPESRTSPNIHHHSVPSSSRYAFHLPSPPSSTLVDPVKSTQHPPALTLDIPLPHKSSPSSPFSQRSSAIMPGAICTIGDSYVPTSPQRTPEDESAASLLLQISNSPHSHTSYSGSMRSPTSPSFELPKPVNVASGASGSSSRPRQAPRSSSQLHSLFQAQTPSSLLGLDRVARQPL